MIILISPAKTFTKSKDLADNKPFFINESQTLINEFNKLNLDEIKKTFKVSDKIAEQTILNFNNINNNFTAVFQYGGTAYKYLNPEFIDRNKFNNLYILSGLYGILNALDGISPYRLEISSNFSINLYKYWSDKVNTFLENKNDMIINLASNEYTKHLDHDKLNIITINFFEVDKGNNYSNHSMLLKKLRGLMTNYILVNDINSINDIKNIIIDDFIYDKDKSNEKNMIFSRRIVK